MQWALMGRPVRDDDDEDLKWEKEEWEGGKMIMQTKT